MIKRIVVGLALLFGILLLTLPKTDEQSVTKLASGSMLMCSMDFRKQVEVQLIKEESVTAEFTNTCPDLIAALEVTETGEITITGNTHPITLTLTPVVEKGGVRWSCHGEPAESVTKLCRSPSAS